MKIRGELRQLVLEIMGLGFTVEFPTYCEDAHTPGVLGLYAGVTDHARKLVKIGRKANPTKQRMRHTLRHELRHVQNPEWDCGNRGPLDI